MPGMGIKIKNIFKPDWSTDSKQPLYVANVSAGFPSPASDYEEEKLDLNKYLIKNPAATYFVRVTGDSMLGAGIHSGDLLVVDRSVEPRNKKVVIANINGELTVKRIRIIKGKYYLEPENEDFQTQELDESMEFEVWGVVTYVIHQL